MTAPFATVDTSPYCGACGLNVFIHNANGDLVCDSCGAPQAAYGNAAATEGTEGSPGSWDGVAPTTPSTETASPATEWSAGSFIYDGVGNQWYWNAAAWAAGVAPGE